MKNFILLVVFVFSSISTFSQNNSEEKIAASPTSENSLLIDTLIKASGFDKYVYDYCVKQIDKVAKENNWDSTKILQQKKKINFNDFKFDVYNAFSFSTKKELEELINFCKTSANTDNLHSVISNNSMIRNNLSLFAKRYLK